MKKVFALFVAFIMCASSAFCVEFAPSVMKISAPPIVQYNFDGTKLEIPITLKGTPASVVFCVFTNGQAENINEIQNGYLGWHFVNKIDTCIYLKDSGSYGVGSDVVTWDGLDQDGKTVPKGDYTYYIWGWDNQSMRQLASRFIDVSWDANSFYQKTDGDGNHLAKPIIYKPNGSIAFTSEPSELIFHKWIIGSDPEDGSLLETTSMITSYSISNITLDQYDKSMFFWRFTSSPGSGGFSNIGKYQWVPNGVAILQTDWGEDGLFTHQLPGGIGQDNSKSVENNNGILLTTSSDSWGDDSVSKIIYVDAEDGTEITRVDMSEWWVRDADAEAGAQRVGGPSRCFLADDGNQYLMHWHSCLAQSYDPWKPDDLGGDMRDNTNWINGNGDYVGDKNFEEDAEMPWACMDYNVGNWYLGLHADSNGFTVGSAGGMGAVTFASFAPDGTGIGYIALAGESTEWGRFGVHCIDYGSAYDGIYTDNMSTTVGEDKGGQWFVAEDSIKGIISNIIVDVEEDTPAAFAVAQNSPNPFNPTTAISFTLTEAGNITVDVFNVAGQKVDTIANEFMSSGSHSVTWDASEFSAGVYFYTVKTGDFSKTMKMTLLK